MSVRIMTLAWAVDLPAGDKLVLLALADCANDEGYCWPGVRSLCAKTGKSERSLQAALKALEEAGQITRDQVPGKGCNYTIHPRNICTPAEIAPPQKTTQTPAEIAGKPSITINNKNTRKTRLTEDWEPKQFADGSKCRRIVDSWSADFRETQIEKFIAYHMGRGSTWVDWQAAWKTWVLNAPEFNRQRSTQPAGGAVPLWKHLSEAGRA